jgi:hypothetical protein
MLKERMVIHMKVSDLMFQLLRYMKEYGDQEILISILTENGNYEFKPCESGFSTPNNYQIEMDVQNVREFKKTIK